MNMKNWKNFFRVHGHSAGGFTLVELIVVIAILAILAGVAIPAYSGYIKKAEKAGDETLLASFNTAFAAACAMNGVDHIGLDAKNVVVTKTAAVGGFEFTVDVEGIEDFEADFKTFYEGGIFKVYGKLVYKTEDGVFEGEEGEATITLQWNGKDYYFNQTSVDGFKGSVYYENVDKLVTDLDSLSSNFGELTLIAGTDKIQEYLGEEFAEFIGDETDPTVIGNKTVLWVAEQTQNMTAQEAGQAILDSQLYLASGNFEALGDDALPSMALMYGSITAYANGAGADSDVAKRLEKGITNKTELVALFAEAMGDDDYAAYVGYDPYSDAPVVNATESFTKDMNGYMGALDAMNTVSGDVTDDQLANSDLWSKGGFLEMLEGLN